MTLFNQNSKTHQDDLPHAGKQVLRASARILFVQLSAFGVLVV
jgi:hypothetical protein